MKREKNKTRKLETDLKPFAMENKRYFIKIPLFVLGIAIVVALIFMFINKDNQYTFEGEITQYYAGQQYAVSKDAYLSKSLEGESQITQEGVAKDITSLAFYNEDENKIILPVDMVYYDPRNRIFDRIDAFTEITITDKGIRAVNGKKECYLNRGFLYDGKDYYIFLEDASVEFNGYKLDVTPMSYAEVIFQFQVTVFDYETKEFMMEPASSEVVMTVDSGEYTVDLLSDMYANNEEDKSLLFTRPDLLDSMLE